MTMWIYEYYMNLIFIHLIHKYEVHIAVNFKLLQKNKEFFKKF